MSDNSKVTALREWLVVILFFCGVALIAAGLWLFSMPLAMIFLGLAVLYLAACISKAAKSNEKDGKK